MTRALAVSGRRGDPRAALRTIEGREEYLSFALGAEVYAVPVKRVREILKLPPLTEVPRAAADLLGIVNVRGLVLPVRDLRRRLRIAARPPSRRARVLVVDHEEEPLGLLVDEVRGVVRLLPGEIETSPAIVRGLDAEAVAGVARPGGEMLILLGLDAVLARSDAP